MLVNLLLPDGFFTAALIRRTAWLWLGARVIVAMFGFLAAVSAIPTAPRDVFLIVLIVCGLGAVELRRRREFVFFANLGTAPATVILLGGFTALLLELMLAGAKVVLR